MSRLLVALLWVLHWLPLPLLAALGRGFGALLFHLARSRRHVAEVNLRLCFPEWTEEARRAVLREHFRLLGRSIVERGVSWFASAERIRRLVRLEGKEGVDVLRAQGRPVILLVPHFLGLDMGGTRVAMEYDGVYVYSRPKRDPVADRWLNWGRSRFGDQLQVARQDGIRPVVRALRAGRPLYYLPDLDYGRKESVFVPFFGVPAATITGLSRLARLTGAAVVPCVTEMLPDGKGYVTRFGEPWADFPSEDEVADAARMNRWLEGEIRRMPAQYHWVHRRFKTRPPGEPRLY